MRKIKKIIKIFLIRLVVGFLNASGMSKNKNSSPERFLIISTTGIGDTLWGTPAIRALKETYPECYISVLTNPAGLELLDGNPHIDNISVFSKGISGLISLPGLLRSLRKQKIEVAFIFHASDRIIWPVAFLTGAGKIIGIQGNSKELDFILTNPVKLNSGIHGIESRLSLVKQVSAVTEDKAIEIFIKEEEKADAERLLSGKGIPEGSLVIGFHPGAQKVYKCWPSEKFIELGRSLVKNLECRIVVTGNNDEKELADMISANIQGSVSLAGDRSLRQTASLIGKINVFITNDTGPMHIALALKTPVIALFSPTDPGLCGPYKAKGKYIVISKPLTCTPCIGKSCANPECMGQIDVDEVMESVESLLKGGK